MKKILTSASLVALGATALNAYDPEMTRVRTGRPWSVSAVVRGFYDDNPNTQVSRLKDDSFGFEVSPSVHLNLPFEQTFLRVGYIYSLRYYEDRPEHKHDQGHEFNALLRHTFGPRHDISISESFIVSKEPTVIDRSTGIVTAPTRETRSDADAFHNRAGIDYNVMLTQLIGLSVGYVNNWYDYRSDNVPGSRSALLDRFEHLFRIDGRYQVNPSLMGFLGYSFGVRDYVGDQIIVPGTTLESDDRDSRSHFFYAGVEHDFSERLSGILRAGVQYTDYHQVEESEVSPYVDASLRYAFLPESAVRLGVRHQRNATDIAVPDRRGRPTLDQETTAGFVELSHRITRNLFGTLIGQVQHSTFTGGFFDGDNEALYLVGANLEYRFNYHWSVETGYNYDLLDSDIGGRTYHRNRVYVGVRASY